LERQASDTLQREGFMVSTAAGGHKPHPALRVLEGARRDAARMREAFGLTPRARQALDVPSQLELFDPSSRFFN
jgi:P27 family predicted phage terminase small subunit